MYYVAKLTREGKHWLVDFPDCPGCQTFGDSKEEALDMAADALAGWLASTLKHGEVPPAPKTRARRAMVPVAVPAPLAAIAMIRRRRAELGLTQKQLAPGRQFATGGETRRSGHEQLARLDLKGDAVPRYPVGICGRDGGRHVAAEGDALRASP